MGKFITFEGGDGCGKTSVIKAIIEKLENDGHIIVKTREPGGSSIAEKIRNIILDVDNTGMEYVTESLLYAACRSQHLHDIVIPSLEAGKVVICDRFVDSSYVYQGIARGVGFEKVREINELVVGDHMPDLTIYIDATPEICLARRNSRDEAQNRLDLESLEFHHKVRNGYKEICEMFKDRIVTIDGDQPLEKVIEDTYSVLKEFLKG
jgi:dTMP kinase